MRDLRIFGSIAYAHVPKELRKKLDSKTKECIFLGYSGTSKGYKLWCPKKQGVILSRDVIFDEDSVDLSILSIHTPTEEPLQDLSTILLSHDTSLPNHTASSITIPTDSNSISMIQPLFTNPSTSSTT